MEKLYYHPSFYLAEDGKWRCSYCHKVSNNGMIPEPCVYPTAAQSVFDDYRFEISVWNCRVSILCFVESNGKRDYYTIECSSNEIKEKLNKLAKNSVYDAGGAINISGIYPLSEELENFLEDKIKNKEITLKGENI